MRPPPAPNRVTVCLAYYRNPSMLEMHYARFRALPDDLKAQLELIVVDDGSPVPAVPPGADMGLAFSLYRIFEDVRWNQDAARNIAAEHAAHDWLLLTDMDHMVPEATLRRLVFGKMDRKKVYRFSRVDWPHLWPYKPHPNSWAISRPLWDQVGGYDERYSGLYGSDAPFRDSLARAAKIALLPEVLIRVPREVVADASTPEHVWGRKTEADRVGMRRVKAEIAALPEEERRPLRRGFACHRVFPC